MRASRTRSALAAVLPRENLAASLYGTVLATSVLAALPGVEQPGWAIAALLVTALVFTIAHAWAHALAHGAARRAPVDRRVFAASIRHEWPMVEAALPAVAAIALVIVGVYSMKSALWTAVLLNVVLLFAWGFALRRLAGGGPGISIGAGLAAALLGLSLAALKLLIH